MKNDKQTRIGLNMLAITLFLVAVFTNCFTLVVLGTSMCIIATVMKIVE
jgi:hypothetical protein